MKISPDKLRLYAVTDRTWLGKESLEEAVEAALRGGVTILQLREKQAPHEELVKTAMRLKPLCRRYGVPLIINDDVEAALEADADGVHVGQEDMAVAEARRILGPEKIIGASAHNREEALEALPDPAGQIDRFLLSKLRGRTPDEKEKKRLCDALARRGFAWPDIRAAWSRLGAEITEN